MSKETFFAISCTRSGSDQSHATKLSSSLWACCWNPDRIGLYNHLSQAKAFLKRIPYFVSVHLVLPCDSNFLPRPVSCSVFAQARVHLCQRKKECCSYVHDAVGGHLESTLPSILYQPRN